MTSAYSAASAPEDAAGVAGSMRGLYDGMQLWDGSAGAEAALRGTLASLRYPSTFMVADLAFQAGDSMLAQGGFGYVRTATIVVPGQGSLKVAVKKAVCKWVEVVNGKQQQKGSEAQRSRSIMKEIAAHQHVQSLGCPEVGYCVGWCWQPEPTLLTLLYPAGTLKDAAVRLPLDQVLTALLDVATAVAALQSGACGLYYVHADIKPNNVALTADHRGRLIDMGVAMGVAISDGEASSEQAFAGGPPGYCAPELRLRRVTQGGGAAPQRTRGAVGPAGRYNAGRYTDVYSLAATIVRVLGYGSSTEEQYTSDSGRFGTDHRRCGVARLMTMEFRARQELVSQLAARLADTYSSLDTSGGTASLVRLRLAQVLLECLQLDRKARPGITALVDALEYCLANVASW
jgi:serine/threonine protein kinase